MLARLEVTATFCFTILISTSKKCCDGEFYDVQISFCKVNVFISFIDEQTFFNFFFREPLQHRHSQLDCRHTFLRNEICGGMFHLDLILVFSLATHDELSLA